MLKLITGLSSITQHATALLTTIVMSCGKIRVPWVAVPNRYTGYLRTKTDIRPVGEGWASSRRGTFVLIIQAPFGYRVKSPHCL